MPPKLSTTAIGSAFELASLNYLTKTSKLNLSLLRVGGKNDKGIDLRGWLESSPSSSSSSSSRNIPVASTSTNSIKQRKKRWSVIVQCKAESKPIGPGIIRELEGTVGYEDLDKETFTSGGGGGGGETEGKRIPNQTIAFLVSQAGFSKEALLRADASTLPISLLELDFRGSTGKKEGGGGNPISSTMTFNPALKRLLGVMEEVEIGRTRNLKALDRDSLLIPEERKEGHISNEVSIC